MSLYKPGWADKRKLKDLSVCILIPHGSYFVWNKFVKSLSNLIIYSWMNGLKIHLMGSTERMIVHWARNSLAREVKDLVCDYTGEKFTHLLWLDDDHVFNPDMALYLAQYSKLDMVSALYYKRTEKPVPVVYTREGVEEIEDELIHNTIVIPPNTLFECDAVGFGAMLMRRDVLDRVPEPWFTFDNKGGEDISFCVQAKKHGIRVWCDPRYKLGHIGDPQIITEATYKQYLTDHKDEMGEIKKVKFEVN